MQASPGEMYSIDFLESISTSRIVVNVAKVCRRPAPVSRDCKVQTTKRHVAVALYRTRPCPRLCFNLNKIRDDCICTKGCIHSTCGSTDSEDFEVLNDRRPALASGCEEHRDNNFWIPRSDTGMPLAVKDVTCLPRQSQTGKACETILVPQPSHGSEGAEVSGSGSIQRGGRVCVSTSS